MYLKVLLLLSLFVAANFAKHCKRTEVYYPCGLEDTNCIRTYLGAHSLCSRRTFEAVPHNPTVFDFDYETPYFNASHIEHYLTGRNFERCKVSAFFTNRTSRVTVMAIDCPDLGVDAYKRIILHNPGDEDTYVQFKIEADYKLVTLTVNLDNPDFLDICKARAYTYIHQLPTIHTEASDAQSREYLRTDPRGMRTHLNILVQELWTYRASVMFQTYVNSYLCNFACGR